MNGGELLLLGCGIPSRIKKHSLSSREGAYSSNNLISFIIVVLRKKDK